LLRTYHQRFGLRYTPPTLFNIAFTAGTTHLLSAVRHHGTKIKDGAVANARECVDFLHSVAESWPAAGQKADILDTLVKEYQPHAQTSDFEQAITLSSNSSQRGMKESHVPQGLTYLTALSAQPITAKRQSTTNQSHDTIFSSTFSSSISDAEWQLPTSYPFLESQIPLSQEGVAM
jgi:hypothetical protein